MLWRLFGVLVGLILLVAFVAWVVVRLTMPAPVYAPAANPVVASGPTVDCGDGTWAFSAADCNRARQQNAPAGQPDVPTRAPDPPPPIPTNTPVPTPTPIVAEHPPIDEPAQPVNLSGGGYDAGSATVSLSAGQAIIGQSYEVNGRGGGCQVFGGNGPASVSVVDGEWWIFDTTLSDDDLQRLLGLAEQHQRNDPQAQCDGGSQITRI